MAEELPKLFGEYALDRTCRAALTQHADGLKDWMSGILEWHRRCLRYTETELRRNRRLHATGREASSTARAWPIGPTGPGTSSTRLTPAAPGKENPYASAARER